MTEGLDSDQVKPARKGVLGALAILSQEPRLEIFRLLVRTFSAFPGYGGNHG